MGLLVLLTTNVSAIPWINEFHYDNDSTDTGEFIEVAGNAGDDLTGWSIVFYDGGDQEPYNSGSVLNLSGVIPNEGGTGFGALSWLKSGIQNGGPDGFALVDNSGNVIEFLSYEGAFTASGGPADGMNSVDVGVAESNSTTPVGHSLQRTGNGIGGADFDWVGPLAASPGSLNAGQTFIVENAEPSGGSSSVPDAGTSLGLFLGGLGLISVCRARMAARCG